jgi:hypothetical protein
MNSPVAARAAKCLSDPTVPLSVWVAPFYPATGLRSEHFSEAEVPTGVREGNVWNRERKVIETEFHLPVVRSAATAAECCKKAVHTLRHIFLARPSGPGLRSLHVQGEWKFDDYPICTWFQPDPSTKADSRVTSSRSWASAINWTIGSRPNADLASKIEPWPRISGPLIN